MANTFFLIFTYFIEAAIVYLCVKSLYKSKFNTFTSFFIILVMYEMLLILFRFIFTNEIANIIAIILVNISAIFLLFKSSLKSAIFHGTILGILQLFSEFFISNITALFFNTSSQKSIQNYFEIGAILSMSIYFLLTRILVSFSLKEKVTHYWGKWFSLFILPSTSIFVTLVFRIISKNVVLNPIQNSLITSAISLLLLVNIAIYIIYDKAEKNNQKLVELELANQKNDIDVQYLELLEKKNETMNIMAHDYKNNILTISSMTDSNEIKEYIDHMLGEITKYNQIAKTKNRFLDVILSKYTYLCNDKGIKFETDINTVNLSFINCYDISSLFNNILDNAVEATSTASDKYIRLEISNSLNAFYKIIVENSCDVEPKTDNNGKFITSKKNKDGHGYGIKSIKKVVNKYDGEIQWKYDYKIRQFKVIIIFPINR